MWYFELQPDHVESTYTPNCQDFCPAFLLMLKRQCFFAHVKTAVYQGYGYANTCDVQISGHIDIEFCI